MNITDNISSQFLLDPEVIFLNHGSFGATPRPVFEQYQDFQRSLEYRPIEFLGRQFHDLIKESRQFIGKYFHTDSDNLVFVPNTTTGINIVARSLRLNPGDEVLSTDHEYGAMDRTWHFLSLLSGFSYNHVQVEIPTTGSNKFVENFFSHVNLNTKVIFLSHITSPTSIIFPVKEICEKARSMGILTIIDGAHAPGQIPLNLDEIGADFYTGNFHKWLCAPKGSAFLYARPDVQSLIKPLVVSWGYESDEPGVSTFQDYLDWTGTKDISAYLSVPSAIQFQEDNHWDLVRSHCHDLATSTLSRISTHFNLPTLYGHENHFAQMATIPLPQNISAADLKNRLYDKYHIEIPVIEWNDHLMIRLSVQGYNTAEQMEALCKAVFEIFD